MKEYTKLCCVLNLCVQNYHLFCLKMSRHRDVRKLDYDEEYEDVYDGDVYGDSVDETEFGISPSTAQYMYIRNHDDYGFGAYLPTSTDIKEEEESGGQSEQGVSSKPSGEDRNRHDSATYEKPTLTAEDEVRLNSVLDELHNIVGDQFNEGELIKVVISNNFELESSLNVLLDRASKSATAPSPSAQAGQPKPMPQRERRNRARGIEKMAASGIAQLKVSGKDETAEQSAEVPAKPVVVSTPLKPDDSPKVVRGFEVDKNDLHINDEGGIDSAIREAASNSIAVEDEERRLRVPSPARVDKMPIRLRDRDVDIENCYKERCGGGKELLNLVVVGHVDAGKSTLMGHLLYLRGNVTQRTMHKYEQESKKIGKQSFMYAWVLDDTDEERSRGVTVDVAQRMFETESKVVTLLDAPGHRDFIPNMITGAARADVAVLVVDATTGAFEAGFESGGQTREHAILIRSLGISQLVVAINKLDTVDWSQARFKEITDSIRSFLKTVGFRDPDVTYVPCSGLTGENLTKLPTVAGLKSWHPGPSLLQAIDKLKVPKRSVLKPVRLCISDVYKGQGSNVCIAGRLETGYIQHGDRLMLMPQGEVVSVKGIQTENAESGSAFAGDHVTVTIAGVDPSVLHVGDFLCDPTDPILQVTRIQARIVVFALNVPIVKGSQVDFHYQSITEPAHIRKLLSQLHKSTGQVVKLKPRALLKNTSAVIELEFSRQICLELYQNYKELGRFMLRTGGTTVAAGVVTQILG